MSDVFLSYRRDDAASATGRLADRLAQEFGPEHIFRDVESIAAGEDFLERILAALHQAKLMIVVIGPRWLDAHDAAGARRLECPDDYVRLEIRSALGMELPLIPVLVDGARVPRITELPEDLKPLASRHAIELTDRGWGSETNDLLRVLTERYGVSPGGNVHSPIIWDAIVAWPRNLFDFVTDPARFLARKVLDTHASLARASVFWILSLAIGLPCQSLITHFEGGSVFEIATILARLLTLTLALATSVHVAWRIAGIRLPLVTAFTLSMYQTAMLAFVLPLVAGIFLWLDLIPDLFLSGFAAGRGWVHSTEFRRFLGRAAFNATGVIMAMVFGWYLWSMGVYRRIVIASRRRRVIAAISFVLLFVPALLIVFAIAAILSSLT